MEIAGLTRREFCRIRRVNLLQECPEPKWPLGHARRAARRLLPDLRGRTAFLLGNSVQQAFDWALPAGSLPTKQLVWVQPARDVMFVGIPHPSGRSQPYNTPETRQMVADLVAVAIEHPDDFLSVVARL
jgi:hypothetical protein